MTKHYKILLIAFSLLAFLSPTNFSKVKTTNLNENVFTNKLVILQEVLASNDNVLPIINLESYASGESNTTYKLTANESLTYLKIELSKDLYVTLYKGFYGSTDEFGWHIAAQKDAGTIMIVNVFEDGNDYSLKYAGSVAKITMSEDETQFILEISGPIAKQIKAQKDFLVLVKDVGQNEVSLNFNHDTKKSESFNASFIDYLSKGVSSSPNPKI